MAANTFAQRGTKGGLFEKEWFRHIEQRQDVLRRTESLWSDRSRPPRKPKALPPAKAWAPGDERTPVIIVTGPIGGGKSSVVGHLAARDALVITHRYWQDWGTTPPPPLDDGIDRASVFDFGNACVCCAPDGDLQALLKKKRTARSVVIETTGTADPALFARVLHQDTKLRELYVLRSVVFVADARDVRKQLAVPDSPGAPNPHRLQLLAANHAVLTRGGDDDTLPGFAGPVDYGRPGRGALGGFDATAVVERRMDFLGVDPTRPCRFVRPVVSFAPSDGVLRAVAVVEQGAARETDVLAFVEELAASSAVARFRVASDGASTGALLIDGGRAGDKLRIVRRDDVVEPDDGVEPDDDASTSSSEASEVVDAGDWRREAAPQLRLFVLGTKLDAASLREGLRSCLVPEGFRYAADEELDFGVCSDDDPLSRCLAGAPEAPRDRVCTTVNGASIEIARVGPRRYTATDAAGATREVVRLFESALYVK